MKRLAATLLCAWIYWHMFIVDREQKFVPMTSPTTQQACIQKVRALAPHERRHGPVVWYADIHESGHWYGCWPEDFDPRDPPSGPSTAPHGK